MSSFIKLSLLSLLFVASVSQATIMKCTGMYDNGDPVHILFDDQSMTLNFDGTVHKITGTTENKKGLTTENFKNDNDEEVYISFVNDDGDLYIKLFKAKNDDLIDTIHLACTKED